MAVVAEWLRRLTRNQFPSGSVGSNPTNCDNFLFRHKLWHFQNFDVSCVSMSLQVSHRWFSGRMLACHAGRPGSIPGRCKLFLEVWQTQSWGKSFGGAGYRSRYLSHAKRALYHLSYAPSLEYVLSVQQDLAGRQQCKLVLKDTFHHAAGNHDL